MLRPLPGHDGFRRNTGGAGMSYQPLNMRGGQGRTGQGSGDFTERRLCGIAGQGDFRQ